MNRETSHKSTILEKARDWRWLILLLVTVAVVVLYFAKVDSNPPGYYIDESSISYNAYTIAQTGRDEFGKAWPLYFRAFGDYKNPVYIYLLAGIYKLTGPSILAARFLSALCGVLAGLGLGLLATRITKRREVGILVALMALLTPWLFEISRVVLEVSLYPICIVLFLLCAHHVSTKIAWSWKDTFSLALTLALLTYTYSIGRMVGPLFALGLIFFASRERRGGVLKTWALYAVTLVPILQFQRHNSGALTGRFTLITFLKPPYAAAGNAWEFIKHYFGNMNPWRLFVTGDPNVEQIAHLYGAPLLLAATGLLAIGGLVLILRHHWTNPWWRLVVYCLAVSIVPASLTKEYVHILRLAPLPVLILVLTIPALEWLTVRTIRRQAVLALLLLLMFVQGATFFWRFETDSSAKRLRQFDHGYPEQILGPALSMNQRPVYITDALAIPGYIQAYWYATLRGIPVTTFVRLRPDEGAPDGGLVISTEENCPRCRIIATNEFYTLYVADGPELKHDPLPETAFRAQLKLISPVSSMPAGGSSDLIVLVKNESNVVWTARERSGGVFQVSAGNHWLDQQGNMVINDDGRAALLRDLGSGQETELKLTVNAPGKPGNYLLEIDMVQEGVSWFGLKGSRTLRLPIKVG